MDHHDSHLTPAILPQWDDQVAGLAQLALVDLHDDAIRPCMVAFHDEQALFLATLRPFGRGEHQGPLIEVGALAMALGANRLAVSLAGRAWSTEDPIPPVSCDGDLRQRVLVVHTVDDTASPASSPAATRTHLWPVEQDHGEDVARLGEPLVEDHATGWVVEALQLMVRHAAFDLDDVASQVARCEALGHVFAWGPHTVATIEIALADALRGSLDGGRG